MDKVGDNATYIGYDCNTNSKNTGNDPIWRFRRIGYRPASSGKKAYYYHAHNRKQTQQSLCFYEGGDKKGKANLYSVSPY